MNLSRWKLLFASLAACAVIAPASLMAQVAEINPYMGMYWPTTSSAGHLQDEGTFGIRAGYFVDGALGYRVKVTVSRIDATA